MAEGSLPAEVAPGAPFSSSFCPIGFGPTISGAASSGLFWPGSVGSDLPSACLASNSSWRCFAAVAGAYQRTDDSVARTSRTAANALSLVA